MITIDGSVGEGGGQILRTALSLSMITGAPFRIERIRAKRAKPGLLRQHLTCVKAAIAVAAGKADGAELGSTQLTFTPGAIRGGDYEFAIGSAGSTTLVFQTILPALLTAARPSRVILSGGTHNPSAPTFDYLDRVYRPQLQRMGVYFEPTLERAGFYPAGGGVWSAAVTPCAKFAPFTLEDAGAVLSRRIVADVAHVAFNVAEREVRTAATLLSWPPETMQPRTVDALGPGNVLAIKIQHEHVTEIATSFGERNLSAEAVAAKAVDEVRNYLGAKVPVGAHLADQLLLPMALAGGGSFVTMRPTGHTRTNIAVVEKFLAVEFQLVELTTDRWRVSVS